MVDTLHALAEDAYTEARSRLRLAIRAQRQPLVVLGSFAAAGALGLALLGRIDCAVVCFICFFGWDLWAQRALKAMAARAKTLDAEVGFRRLALMTGCRHAFLLLGAVAAVALDASFANAVYLSLAAAAVLLLATFQCSFDRRLMVSAAAPAVAAMVYATVDLARAPHGAALATGCILLIAVCGGISSATARIRRELTRREAERAAMVREVEKARDAALEDRRRVESTAAELARSAALSAQTARMARIGSWELDTQNGRLFWSEQTYRIRHMTPGAPIDLLTAGRTYALEDQPKIASAMRRLIEHGEPFDEELAIHTANGATIWTRNLGEAETVDGKIVRVFGSVQDISDRRAQEQRISQLAYRDSLTGLPNRVAFYERLADALTHLRSEKTKAGMGLLLVDVDHFKDVNDTLGHDAGDELLSNVSERLRVLFDATVTVARLGGDEFALVVPEAADGGSLLLMAQAACRAIAHPLSRGGFVLECSATIGAVFCSDGSAQPSSLLKSADIALYEAKAAGRNRAALFEVSMRERIESRMDLLREVRAALAAGELEPSYQPIVDLPQGQIVGFEALVRWRKPGAGVLSPPAFGVALEDPDLSLRIGDMMLDRVLRQAKAWMMAGVEFGRIAINLAPSQFRRGDVAQHIAARLAYWGVPPEKLGVEITESVYLGDRSESVIEAVSNLRAMGVRIALDDFGTGYASLANLRHLPIDILKIDKSFLSSGGDMTLVQTVVELGIRLGVRVVAEGVEDREQLSRLISLGCHKAQGYLFGHPAPASEVPGVLVASLADVAA